jgi:DNA-binding XRE family transcriptional regulator
MYIDVNFADALRTARRNVGMTQVEAAKAIGISVGGLIQAEGGRVGGRNRKKIQKWVDKIQRTTRKGGWK